MPLTLLPTLHIDTLLSLVSSLTRPASSRRQDLTQLPTRAQSFHTRLLCTRQAVLPSCLGRPTTRRGATVLRVSNSAAILDDLGTTDEACDGPRKKAHKRPRLIHVSSQRTIRPKFSSIASMGGLLLINTKHNWVRHVAHVLVTM